MGLIPGLAPTRFGAQRGFTLSYFASWGSSLEFDTADNTLLPPNPQYPNCSTSPTAPVDNPGVIGMSSFHSGGANVLICDGFGRFLKTSTSLSTIWALGSITQGEIVSADAF